MDKVQRNFQSLQVDTKWILKEKEEDYFSIKHNKPPSIGQMSAQVHPLKESENEHKKRWYQLPRITPKRPPPPKSQIQTNQLKLPTPPPQLLTDLNWSTIDNYQSFSTPVSPIIDYRDLTGNNIKHKKTQSSDQRRLRPLSYIEFEKTPFDHSVNEIDSINQRSPLKLSLSLSSSNNSSASSLSTAQDTKTTSTRSSTTINTTLNNNSSSSTVNNNNSPSNQYNLFNIHTKDTKELVINFKNIKPRTTKLKRKPNMKLELKAFYEWQFQLLMSIQKNLFPRKDQLEIPEEKKLRYLSTRKFILNEFYTTEINYWNQLNFTKVMFFDPIQLALDKNSPLVKPSDLDLFANLNDLMKFSSTFILKFRNQESANDVHLGSILRELAEYMVVFLRCAVDFKTNKKLMDQRQTSKGYALYLEKLTTKKETRQFTFNDYLIVPIQRITRYGLLLSDLDKHTEPSHPDAENIRIARYIIHSLATAMNFAQK